MRGVVKLVYTKVIDAGSAAVWDKHVFEDTHREFFMQAQQFDQQGRFETYTDMLQHVPKAENINYLVSTAAVGYLKQLKGFFPDVLNTMGKACVPFSNFKFELVQSHIKNKSLHKVAIHLYSETLVWIDSIDKHFVFALAQDHEKLVAGTEVDTHTVLLLPNVGIASIKKV